MTVVLKLIKQRVKNWVVKYLGSSKDDDYYIL